MNKAILSFSPLGSALFLVVFPLRLACAQAAASSSASYHVAVATDAAGVAALKATIAQDQKEVVKARFALKKALSRKGASVAAEQAWLAAKGRLKADRDALRASIEVREKERAEARKLHEKLHKTEAPH